MNNMKLTFAAKSENESFARSVVAAFFAQLNPTVQEIEDIKTAVSEAVTNCIVHGYCGRQEGDVTIECVLDEGKMVGLGTHDELMQTCPVYREIYYSQYEQEVKRDA